MIQTLAAAAGHIRFDELGLSPVAIDLGFFDIKWYSITYILSILGGWWYLLKLLNQPGAPMARRHADDLVFYATLGIILGGRLGYILFYAPDIFLHPLRIFRLWEGGMSWHGGVIGTSLAIILFARKNKLDWLRVHDYVAVVTPIGPLLVRIANFVNGELWGKPSDLPWAVVFPHTVAYGLDPARHPSQIYESLLEGGLMLAVMAYAFWRTRARYAPGKLVGIFILGYGLIRFFLEFFREPDAQLVQFAQSTGLHMGQWLCLPMIFGGIYLIASANGRRQRVEPIAGSESVA